jgi:YidC/Oxa1 family membrane protein insertase
MNLFDVLVVQPIFNTLLAIYSVVGDFGLSIIIFTVLIRIALWPLLKSQLHQTKLMRTVQPELKKIKAKTKGNKQLETQMMLELYRERGIKPFNSIGILIVQIPIFIGIYQVITIITSHRDQIDRFLYDFVRTLPGLESITGKSHDFNESLLGFMDLTKSVVSNNEFHISLLILAIIAGILQYIQSKQIMPKAGEQKRLRDILKDASEGKEADQAEITAAMSNKLILFMPILLVLFALYLPAAVVLYYAASSFVAIIQQHYVLKDDGKELVEIASEKTTPEVIERKGKNGTTVRIKKTKKAKTISSKKVKRR